MQTKIGRSSLELRLWTWWYDIVWW